MIELSPELQMAIFHYKSALNFFGKCRESERALNKLLLIIPPELLAQLEEVESDE